MTTRRQLLQAMGTTLLMSAAVAARAADDSYEDAVRRTWRHADDIPTDTAGLHRELVRYATLAPNGHNTQPWGFRLRSDGIDILPDLARRTPVVDPDDHHLWASLGCATENLIQAAQALGQTPTVAVADAGIRIDLARATAQRSALFEAIPLRQSTRSEYDGRALSADDLRQLERAAADAGVTTVLLTDRPQINRVRDFVIAGNSAQMANPAFIRELKTWIRFSRSEALAQRDGLFAGASGSPAMPRWLGAALFGLFVTAHGENERYAAQMRSSAGVAVFAADRANARGWVAAGRACERFLLQAAALDIRTAFVNQPVEVQSVRAQFAAAIGLGERRPDLVVRFGRGPRLPRSLRRPVDAVLVA
jgi:nitroreductase